MNDKKKNKRNEGPIKVYFITSNQSSLDDKLEYSLTKTGMINLKKVHSKIVKYKGEDFSVTVFAFDVEIKKLRENDYDKENKKYKAVIKLKQKVKYYPDSKFEGFILFKETKNNFIFDFKFEDYNNFMGGVTPAPPYIRFPHSSQLKFYNEVFKKLKIMQNNPLVEDLIMDCQNLLIGKAYNIDFILEILKSCYTQKPVKTLLMTFNLKKTKMPSYQIDPKGYSSILRTIENNKEKITKYCSENDNKEKYYKSFFSLLLYFRFHFEREKIEELLSKKELWIYYKEILPNNYKIFDNLNIPQELINEMLKQEKISFSIIEGVLFYMKLFEKILTCINENIDLIYGVCIKEKNNIKLNDLTSPKQEDDFEKILIEIDKLINYELKKGKFVLFEEEFFNNYLHFFLRKI